MNPPNWVVFVAYSYSGTPSGEIVSLHGEYADALRKLRSDRTGCWAIREVGEEDFAPGSYYLALLNGWKG